MFQFALVLRGECRVVRMKFLFQLLFYFLLISLSSYATQDDASKSKYRHRCPSANSIRNKLVIHHIAVGQGDSTFIKTPQGLTLLIDGGVPSRGENEIIPLLKECYKIKSLDYVVLTHFDIDHQGGLTEVLSKIRVKKAVYDPGDSLNSKNTEANSINGSYVKAANASRKRKVPELNANNFLVPNGDKTKIDVVAIGGKILSGQVVDIRGRDKKPADDNSISIALKIKLGNFDYFIAGDLTGGGSRTPDIETPTASAVGDIDVLHLDHHGSSTSNNQFFLETLHPEQVIVSVGDGGMNAKYKLPAAEVMERISKLAFIENVFQTAHGESEARDIFLKKVKNEEGDIIVLADENEYSINEQSFRVDHRD